MVKLIDTDSARGTGGLASILNAEQSKCCLESEGLISRWTPNSGLKSWLCHMSPLFTGLGEILPPIPVRPAVLFYYLSPKHLAV